jgi:hypothetical protein
MDSFNYTASTQSAKLPRGQKAVFRSEKKACIITAMVFKVQFQPVKYYSELAVMAYTHCLSTQEAEAGGSQV